MIDKRNGEKKMKGVEENEYDHKESLDSGRSTSLGYRLLSLVALCWPELSAIMHQLPLRK